MVVQGGSCRLHAITVTRGAILRIWGIREVSGVGMEEEEEEGVEGGRLLYSQAAVTGRDRKC